MKTYSILTIATVLIAAFIGNQAFAGTTSGQDAQGAYERHGRFLKPLLGPAVNDATDAPVSAPAETAGIDKGDRGQYVRHGRFVKEVTTAAQREASAEAPVAAGYRIVDHGKHIHRYPA
ncbi:MAG: hypothetical protein HYV27_07815 [Candidatus Hydrogenedentes bacterium]|nr:hypothetical protein [Candidatus Hydrogenedentota bacterium]